MTDLNDLFKAAAEEKRKLKEEKENSLPVKVIKQLEKSLKEDSIFSKPKLTIQEVQEVQEVHPQQQQKIAKPENLVSAAAASLNNDSFQQPKPQPIDQNLAAITKKLQFLEQAVGKIASTGPGGGEVNLRWLDDIDRSTIQDGYYLGYNGTSKKFEFSAVSGGSGGVAQIQSDWNVTDNTLKSFIKNKPTLFDGAYASLTGKPTLFSGSYTDLTNIPAAYSLPTSSTTVLGGVKVDGTTITIASGVISSPAQTTVTGNAGSATILQTARTINGVSFDGSANITIKPRVSTPAVAGTYAIDTDSFDMVVITGQNVNITNVTTTGTPTNGQKLWFSVTGTAARTISFNAANFEASTVALPTTTVTTNRLDVGFVWNAATSKWRCVAQA